MALLQGSEHFTKWTHVENGQVLNRRLHRIEVQANDGRLYVLTGNKLPDFIQTCAGRGHKGLHLAQILLSSDPKNVHLPKPPYQPPAVNYWPVLRDVVHVVIGFFGAGLLQFMVSVASASF